MTKEHDRAEKQHAAEAKEHDRVEKQEAAAAEKAHRASMTSATATPAKVPAPAKPLTTSDHIDRLRTLAACLDRGDAASAKAEMKTMVDDLFSSWTAEAAPLVKGVDDHHVEAMKAHARRLEEICQHAEGGTNHPVSRAATAGGIAWLQVLLPLIMQIIADLLARQTPKPV